MGRSVLIASLICAWRWFTSLYFACMTFRHSQSILHCRQWEWVLCNATKAIREYHKQENRGMHASLKVSTFKDACILFVLPLFSRSLAFYLIVEIGNLFPCLIIREPSYPAHRDDIHEARATLAHPKACLLPMSSMFLTLLKGLIFTSRLQSKLAWIIFACKQPKLLLLSYSSSCFNLLWVLGVSLTFLKEKCNKCLKIKGHVRNIAQRSTIS